MKKEKRIALSEADLSAACDDLLDVYKARWVLDYWRINSGANMIRGRKCKNSMAGFSDRLILFKGGPVVFAELKTDKGKLSPAQIEFQERVHGMWHIYVVIRTLDDLVDVIVNAMAASTG